MVNDAEALIAEGLEHHRAGRQDAAERCYHAAIEANPACADAWHLLALLAREISMLDVAQELVGQAIELAPEIALFRVTLGDILRDLKDTEGAEGAYKAALDAKPDSFEAMTGLGLLYRAQNLPGDALPYMVGALALRPQSPEALSNLGVVLELQGHLDGAIECYRKSLALAPSSLTFLTNLGSALVLRGDFEEGAAFLRQGIALAPEDIDIRLSFCRLLRRQEKYDEALEVLDQAVADFSATSDLLLERGLLLIRMDKLKDAEAALIESGKIHPRPEVSVALGTVAQLQGDPERAIRMCRQAIGMKDDYLPAWGSLARTFLLVHKMQDAESCFRKVLELDPDDAVAHKLLATTLSGLGRAEAALAEFEKAKALDPDIAGLGYEYGLCLHKAGRTEEGKKVLQAILDNDPEEADLVGAATNIAMIYKDMGDMPKGLEYQHKAVSIAKYHSNLIFSMMYASHVAPEEIITEAQKFEAMHCQALVPVDGVKLTNSPDPKRKIRVGFVSADLRDHAVAYFVEPVWQALDRERFEIYAYYSHFATDHVTRRLKQLVTRWRGVGAMSDEALCQQIRDDQVDILVDLSGHTAGNRLLTFARRAAPVQFGWLGHPATTGVKQMDYLLTNAYAEPVGMTEHLSSETLWRLPESYCVYRPGQNSPEVVEVAPCVERGYITFGCFNNLAKVTEDVIRVWSKVLLAVPNSRLMLEWTTFSDPALCDEFASRFARFGVGRERLELVPRRKENQYKLYNQIDIALDPFPCNGGTTGFDTIWMGVPYITLAGHHLMSRMGVMILSNVGLDSLIAATEDEYVGLAVKLAEDRERLFALRQGLRDKMLISPLMDAPRFARHFEAALSGMWQHWCDQQNEVKQS
ncbi:tetratricopeptide repeat protein [Dechloromonas sp. TW-R-39-2]|uniref:O-linked N-acetylglucosamine transferase family protein n=1 Tax=Dechloromonas sp. TW-R-39-2 TaxID=2654218 RepID=UPI00193E06B4|nr:tetratricopeptide repeat protein [Dechloromonas sp. TW-R-39-2]QRM20476.1 tetratricopeptide repeat protein [Dechloromonas sp. TW-R-39-2]